MENKYIVMLRTALYGLLTLLLSTAIAWFILAQSNFLYGFWHDNIGIAEAIEQYAPQNRYRNGFADTTKAQRVELFAEINKAIHQNGEGLSNIFYKPPGYELPSPLLNKDEIVHLQDVAKLIRFLMYVLVVVVFAWAFMTYSSFRSGRGLPSVVKQFIAMALVFALLGFVLLVFGSKNVFSQLHIWIFPDNHKWFFYYQESLMSTMMWAPYLFGWIAGAWGLLTIVIFSALQYLLVIFFKHSEMGTSG